jgi:hypothetical protein
MLLRGLQLAGSVMNVNNGIKTAIATTPDQARGFINRYSGDHNLYYAPNPVRVKDQKAKLLRVSVRALEEMLNVASRQEQ